MGDSRELVEEILQQVEGVPAVLRDLVVSGAEGNPFFTEELIKMLIEEGVIHKGETVWSVDAERLGELQVPQTLTGVLQARLDRLPFDQHQVLQQASVIGRLFWDLAVAYIAAAAQTEPHAEEVDRALDALQGREMVFPGATTSIQGVHEYLFKHALLREVTYEGVLKRVRRVYHGLVADWMVAQAGEREGEYTGLLADHLALAGRTEEAVVYLRRAAEQAAAGYANAEAVTYYTRALELTPADDAEARYAMLMAREELYSLLGARDERSRDVAALETLAEVLDAAGDQVGRSRRAEVAMRRAAYEWLTGNSVAAFAAVRAADRLAREAQDLRCEGDAHRLWGTLLSAQGEYETARQQFEQAVALARECGARRVEADSLSGLGWVFSYQGIPPVARIHHCFEGALDLYRESGDRQGEAGALINLGVLCVGVGDLPQARVYYERAWTIYRKIGNLPGEAQPLANIAWVYWGEDDYAGARASQEQALAISREVGHALGEAQCLRVISETVAAQGSYALGEARCRQALRIFRERSYRRGEARALLELGLIHYYQGDYAQAGVLLEESWQLSHDHVARWVESKRLAALGMVRHAEGDEEAARDHAQQALENGPTTGYHLGQGDSGLVLGHALAGLGDAAGAMAAYHQALDRYRQSGWLNPPMEVRAGLARLALAQGDRSQALEHTEPILKHLECHTLDGTFDPFRIRLTCYQVLRAVEDDRADEVLRAAYQLLQERAAGIEDERLRKSFLERVPWHRELVAEGERAGFGGRSRATELWVSQRRPG
jgi:tetratricopeptide (TPR) repeat protein